LVIVSMQIREATHTDIPAIARVRIESWRTTYKGIVSQAVLDGLSQEEAEQRVQKHFTAGSFYYVVEDECGETVGFVTGGPEKDGDPIYRGEIYALYLLASHQGRGWGRRLVTQAVERLRSDGYTSLLIWVLTDNHPARRFYEALGGQYVRTQPLQIGPDALTEVAYGWDETRPLLTPSVGT
jgi:ribosomal protein S18 acetylase RimI-like enzyme